MQRAIFVFASSLVAVACGRRPTTVATPAPEDAAPIDAREEDAPAVDRLVAHGRVFDLAKGEIVSTLVDERPSLESSFGDDAYFVTKGGALRAFSIASAKERWSIVARCEWVAATKDGAVCTTSAGIFFYPRDGSARRAYVPGSSASVAQVLAAHDRVYLLFGDATLELTDSLLAGKSASIKLPVMPDARGPRRKTFGLVENPAGVCGVGYGTGTGGLGAFCLDRDGATRWSKTITLSKPTDPPGTYFAPRQLDDRYLVIATYGWSGSVHRAAVVRVLDGTEVARVEQEVTAAITREDGALDGLFVTQPSTQLLEPSGAVRWTSREKLEEATSVVRFHDALIVVDYEQIATGAQLRAFDASTGALRWTGAIELLPISHSKYSNTTWLERGGAFVILRGEESAQSYVELFDPTTGARKASDVQSLW